MRYLQENVFAIRFGLNTRSGAESNDTFQRKLLLHKGGYEAQSAHGETGEDMPFQNVFSDNERVQ
jgi:hypothetical protein